MNSAMVSVFAVETLKPLVPSVRSAKLSLLGYKLSRLFGDQEITLFDINKLADDWLVSSCAFCL